MWLLDSVPDSISDFKIVVMSWESTLTPYLLWNLLFINYFKWLQIVFLKSYVYIKKLEAIKKSFEISY